MLRMLADENFNNDIVRGVCRRNSDLEIFRIQDIGLSGADDPTVLEWAAQNQCVLLTHDVCTMTAYAFARIKDAKAMPGVFEISRRVLLATAIEEIVLLATCSLPGEWEGQVRYLPLR